MKIENFEGNFVKIEGFPEYWVSDIGTVYSERSGKLLSPGDLHGKGHLFITLSKEGKTVSKLVHRLVFEAFYEEPDFEYVIHHLDHNKSNNKVGNLIAMTREDHMRLHREPGSPGKPRQKIRCLENGKEYESLSEAAKDLGVNVGNITRYFQGRVKAVKGYTFEKVEIDDEI